MRLVVLISGSGTNLQAILDAIAVGDLQAQVVAVFSNRKSAYGLERARQAGVPTELAPLKPLLAQGLTREDYDAQLAQRVLAWSPDRVVLAGWMHVLSPAFLDHFPNQVINLHPALPGELPGTDAIRRAWEQAQAGQRTHTGVMVHLVVPEIDAGPVLAQGSLPILPGEDLDTLSARVHQLEHRLLVQALREQSATPPQGERP